MAKWKSNFDERNSEIELQREIDFATHLAGRVLATLEARKPSIFPQKKQPWHIPNDDDVPK